MFSNQKEYDKITGFKYVYPKSAEIKVFPSGRRGITAAQDPFDPESRLNTEFNNRRISSINGFSDSFIKGFDADTGLFTFCLGGYSFSFNLVKSNQNKEIEEETENEEISEQSQNAEDLLSSFIRTLGTVVNKDDENGKVVYANILLEEINLYYADSDTNAQTWILRDQTDSVAPRTILDILDTVEDDPQSNTKEYYFTGITFSNQPLQRNSSAKPLNKQKIVSLCVLEKSSDGEWTLCQRSLLPNITHGDTDDSIQIDTIYANVIKQTVSSDDGSVNYVSTPTLKLVGNQLVFSNVDISES